MRGKLRIKKVVALICTGLSFMLISLAAQAQTKLVTGKVTSADNGLPLPGVTIRVKGSTQAAGSKTDGTYSITVGNNETLIFSFVGYNSQEVPVSGRSTINVSLAPDNKALTEVVVVGYGTAKRKDLTGAVSSVTAEQIAKVPVTSVDQALQGRASGVQVTNNDGAPGASVSVLIRGVGSLASNGNEPLYVVDGYPITGGLNNINPSDIASIDVLKDASATAIYGVRAANGVVIITTKKGRKDGGVQISIDAYGSLQSKPKKYHVLNAQQWATLANEDHASEGNFTELPEWANPSALTNVDWQDAVYRTGSKQNYNLAIRGGNEKIQSAFSVGYYDQKGIVLGSYFKRLNLGMNIDYSVAKWLKSSSSAKYSRQDQNNPFGSGSLQQLTQLIPTLDGGNKLTNQIKDNKGNYGFYNPVNIYTKSWGNPLYTIEQNDYKNLNNYFLANSSLEATIIPGLKIKTNAGVNVSDYSGHYFQPEDLRWQEQYGLSGANQNSVYSQSANNTFEWLWENTISYDKTFGKHTINFVGGVSAQSNTYRYMTGTGDKLINNALRDLAQVNDLVVTGSEYTTTFASQFGRLSYKYADKYIVTGTVRRDGSSKFAQGHQYGVFPSGSVAWKIKEESFLKDVNWISDLKVRGGYGEVGNQGSIPLFQYDALYSSGGAATTGTNVGYPFGKNGADGAIYQPGLAPTQPANNNLRWETDYQTDIGLDAAFLNGDLTFTFDYYNRRSKDFLLNLPVSSQTGFSQNLAQNVGEINNKGLEFAVNYNHSSKEFRYGIGLTFSTVKNKLVSINKSLTFIDNLTTVTGLNANGWGQFSETNIGQPVGEFFGYKSLGIFQSQAQINALNAAAAAKFPSNPYYWKSVTQPGDRYYADTNGDGQVTPSDRTSLGSPIPKFYGGLNLDFSYKAFDINAYFYGSYGNKILNYQQRNLESFQAPGFVGVENVGYDYYVNHWTSSNPSNRYARLTYNDDTSANNVPSSVYVENGSYLRLRNLTFGYSLPSDLAKRLTLSKVRIYFSTQNLFTITGYKGLDPEIGVSSGNATASGIDAGNYPTSKFYTLGLNVTF
ncbi:SusC/RagA family TonB-linked outer membrane protein [Mucilaginibacter celer]|uniref:SusC/RagA family TonB-linked outer membrane protein n=1 Tax=Mucilaginibacter celer TaxID=2305508 RepID=A0A494VV96_9SPHI|nr:TonB-dependent receptor [Mucilaginibacter celer]AYL94912.1 SusC/RagA family TonB-linked outer membrane protein [Mucilaginibacter celer]